VIVVGGPRATRLTWINAQAASGTEDARMRYLSVVLALLVAASLAAYATYRSDLASATEALLTGSVIADTPCGQIEYSVTGDGPAVLLIHGAGGGYSQVAGFSSLLAEAGFRAVAMSRFGYLRTPMPKDASAAAQADAHACLLDALGIRNAAVLGASAGAPSAMQFCLRHADRCAGLILLVPAAYVPGRGATTAPSPLLQFVADHVLTSDLVMWAVTRAWPKLLIKTALATPLEVYRNAPAAEQQRALDMVRDIFPVSPRRAGLRNDAEICSPSIPRYELERISAPTLTISVEDDLFGTYDSAKYTAAHVPGARLVTYPSGGHVWLGHDADVRREIASFLRARS
jgi:2-hydroxy-6-oxonona-2,4-dienedioate hydrolase